MHFTRLFNGQSIGPYTFPSCSSNTGCAAAFKTEDTCSSRAVRRAAPCPPQHPRARGWQAHAPGGPSVRPCPGRRGTAGKARWLGAGSTRGARAQRPASAGDLAPAARHSRPPSRTCSASAPSAAPPASAEGSGTRAPSRLGPASPPRPPRRHARHRGPRRPPRTARPLPSPAVAPFCAGVAPSGSAAAAGRGQARRASSRGARRWQPEVMEVERVRLRSARLLCALSGGWASEGRAGVTTEPRPLVTFVRERSAGGSPARPRAQPAPPVRQVARHARRRIRVASPRWAPGALTLARLRRRGNLFAGSRARGLAGTWCPLQPQP